MTTRILAFAGSTRTDSYNKKLVRIAADAAREEGGDVTLIDLRDFAMPLYDGDLEEREGLPEKCKELKALFLAHQGLLLSCPEYNSSITGVLKNAIDWVSRPAPDEKPLECFRDKVCGLMAASPGALGGLRGLVHVRAILGNIGTLVLPDQVAIMKAADAFDGDGKLKDGKQDASVRKLAASVVRVAGKLQG
jgi:chromate reductase